MKTSSKGLEIIKRHEGLVLKPYLCPARVPTIGYGATYYPNGNKVKMTDPSIDEIQAENMLKSMLVSYENGVSRYVQRTINQNQFDALVSFAYNLGLGALKSSTLLKRINEDPCNLDIQKQFMRWVRAGGKELKGLVKRRMEEAELYFS